VIFTCDNNTRRAAQKKAKTQYTVRYTAEHSYHTQQACNHVTSSAGTEPYATYTPSFVTPLRQSTAPPLTTPTLMHMSRYVSRSFCSK